jgi:hypothetical protein
LATGFKAGARVRLKVSNPPCCGFGDPRKYGEIIAKGRDGVKWQVQLEGEGKPIDIREEDLTVVQEPETGSIIRSR